MTCIICKGQSTGCPDCDPGEQWGRAMDKSSIEVEDGPYPRFLDPPLPAATVHLSAREVWWYDLVGSILAHFTIGVVTGLGMWTVWWILGVWDDLGKVALYVDALLEIVKK